MHPCILIVFIFLFHLPTAYSTESPTPPPRNSPPVCLSRYATYYTSAYTSLFFSHPAEPHFTLSIVTSYMAFYPRTLTAWLDERGFEVDNTPPTDEELCGWTYAVSVDVHGRRHGRILFKHHDYFINSSTMSMISHHDPTTPRTATLDAIERILRDNAPHADILLLRTVLLDLVCGLLGAALLCCAFVGCVENRRKKKMLAENDVELEHIKTHDFGEISTRLSGEGMLRMSTVTEGYQSGIGGGKATALDSSVSTASNVVDPPPIYSLDGAGRLSGRRGL